MRAGREIELSYVNHFKLFCGGVRGILAPSVRESEAQSAVVNDSPVDCQSRLPGSPQRAGFCEVKDWGREYFLFFFLSLRLRLRRIHLPHQREANRCGGTRHS